jgi:SAM-dependent methyltransferase
VSERDEFDTVAAWTEQAIQRLGPADAVPAACNGSGNPFWLSWLGDRLALRAGDLLLDTGAGLGGPAAWLGRHTGARVVTAEPMPAAASGGRRLFGLSAVVAVSYQLPVASERIDGALALAVLSTVQDKAAYLAEVHRVLRDDGALGTIEYVSTADPGGPVEAEPEGNEFVRRDELLKAIEAAGFEVTDCQPADHLPPAPPEWAGLDAAVTGEIERVHGTDPAWTATARQRKRFGRRLAAGDLGVVLVAARRR